MKKVKEFKQKDWLEIIFRDYCFLKRLENAIFK
jgi:hypothetical protein